MLFYIYTQTEQLHLNRTKKNTITFYSSGIFNLSYGYSITGYTYAFRCIIHAPQETFHQLTEHLIILTIIYKDFCVCGVFADTSVSYTTNQPAFKNLFIFVLMSNILYKTCDKKIGNSIISVTYIVYISNLLFTYNTFPRLYSILQGISSNISPIAYMVLLP